MAPPSEIVKKILELPIAEKIYEDAASPATKELGKAAQDVAKSLRLVSAPFQILAGFQDRFTKWVDESVRKIPPENLQAPPPALVGPIIDSLKYRTDGDILTEMFLTLLRRAMNKEQIGLVHPAFSKILEQLSPDEVALLVVLCEKKISIKRAGPSEAYYVFHTPAQREDYRVADPGIEALLSYPRNFGIYKDHMEALLLTRDCRADDHLSAGGIPLYTFDGSGLAIELTDFGRMFIAASYPGA